MKNNRIKIYTLLCLVSAFMFGCEDDFLDTKIDTSITKENLQSNYATIFDFANTSYTYLDNVSNGFNVIDDNLFAVPSDEAVQTSSGFDESDVYTQGIMNPYNNPDDVYNICYQAIRAANYFLENYEANYEELLAFNRDTISDNGISYHQDTENIGWFIAENHVLRAYYYYELVKRYGSVPLVTQTLSLDDNTDLPRTSVSDIVDFIVSEIDLVENDLQVNFKQNDQGKAGRLTRAAALAVKQRTLTLFASPLHNPTNDLTRWQNAASVGNEIIQLGQFSLNNSYRNLFLINNTINSNETVWAIRLGNSNDLERANYPINTPGGSNEITPSHNLVDAYEFKSAPDPNAPYANRDPRLDATITTNNSSWTGRTIETWVGGADDYTTSNVSRTGYYLKKFLNNNLNLVQDQQQQRNWIVFRFGEILLSYAEAMNEAYGPDNDNGYGLSARQAVDQVRNRADVQMPPVIVANQSEMRDKIKHERRIELAFEGHRYWDLIRWMDAEDVLNNTITGVIATNNMDGTFSYEEINVEQRTFDASRMYFYPIPQAEIGKSNGIMTQNTGW